jgi:hypothetical protein
MTKTLGILTLAALPLLAQEGFDFKTLDRLGANAKAKREITLNGDILKFAAGFLGDSKEESSLKPLVENLTGVYVRSFEFDREGQYKEADLEPLRAYLKQGQWNRILESREEGDLSEIYFQPLPNNRLGGLAIIAAEPKEVTVVYISGNLLSKDIAKLSGNLGIPDLPDLKLRIDGGKADKPAKPKKDDEE